MRLKTILAMVIVLLGMRIEAQTTKPATQPVDPKITALIVQLGDDDPHVRDAATDALRKLGKDAMPGLQMAMKDPNAQIRTSAECLVAEEKEREHPTPPVAAADPFDGIILNGGAVQLNNLQGRVQIRMNIVANAGQRVRDMTVNENGHKVHIHEDNEAVKVEVTDNGETKTYEAKTPAELKEKQPEGYKIYEKYMNNGAGRIRIEAGGK